jgi:hypothetical protein
LYLTQVKVAERTDKVPVDCLDAGTHQMPSRSQLGAAIAAVIGASLSAVLWWGGARPALVSDQPPLVLYIGADDCAPCRTWQRGDGMVFRSSAAFARVRYREVKSPHLLDLLKDEHWPEDLRRYREQLGRGAGVPTWLVIVDDGIVEQGRGISQWRERIWPKIRTLH